MASSAMIGLGTVYAIEDSPAGSNAFTPLAEVFGVTFPAGEADEIDVTHYASTSREFIQGLKDYGTADLSINWVPGGVTSTRLYGLLASGEVLKHRITVNAKTYTFEGFVKTIAPEIPVDDRMTATITVRVSGDVVEGDAA